MSIIKSSVINLYDGSTGDHLFQTKVSSDTVNLQCATLPINLTASSISLTNQGGNAIPDAVGTITGMLADITRIAAIESAFNTLFADIEPLSPHYILTATYEASDAIIGITYADGTELSDAELTALVGKYFTYRDTNNTALIIFTAFSVPWHALFTSETMTFVPIGSTIIVVDYVEMVGPRDANYTIASVNGNLINLNHIDGTAISESEKRELVGRWFNYVTYDSTRNRMQNSSTSGIIVAFNMTGVAVGSSVFLV
jgi:hypothetical protein